MLCEANAFEAPTSAVLLTFRDDFKLKAVVTLSNNLFGDYDGGDLLANDFIRLLTFLTWEHQCFDNGPVTLFPKALVDRLRGNFNPDLSIS